MAITQLDSIQNFTSQAAAESLDLRSLGSRVKAIVLTGFSKNVARTWRSCWQPSHTKV